VSRRETYISLCHRARRGVHGVAVSGEGGGVVVAGRMLPTPARPVLCICTACAGSRERERDVAGTMFPSPPRPEECCNAREL